MTTQITAAVCRAGEDATSIETLTVGALRDDEVLVRLVATGICHTDLTCRDGFFPMPRPIVLGHEGAGIVERLGAGVKHLSLGDHVVLSFASCGVCPNCIGGHPAYCDEFGAANMTGRRPDGSTALCSEHGEVSGHFFGQSSFASHSVVRATSAIKVRADAPLEYLGPLACGFLTGVGTVFNVLKPAAGNALAVFGAGGVGLSAVMAAVIAGCAPIIVVEPVAERRALALEIGATHAIDPADQTVGAQIAAIATTGLDYAIDTSGIPRVIEEAVAALSCRGEIALLTANSLEATLPTALMAILPRGLKLHGISMGDATPGVLIPQMVDLFMEGRLPIDRLVRFYDFADIDQAFEDQDKGRTIKPILRICPQGGEDTDKPTQTHLEAVDHGRASR
jgi:aryl-alcohol dehydrogenase